MRECGCVSGPVHFRLKLTLGDKFSRILWKLPTLVGAGVRAVST
jgi:hypothetical protein